MEDRALVRAWCGGDTGAGAELAELYFWDVLAFFRTKVGAPAEELTQKTFLACIEARDRFDPERSFRAYLFGIARLKLLEHFRRHYARAAKIDPGVVSISDLGEAGAGIVTQREEQRVVLRALRTLSIDAQLTLELHYWTGLSVKEISDVLGHPPGTIKARLSRARAALRKALATAETTHDGVQY